MPTTDKRLKSGPRYKGVVQVRGIRKEKYFPYTKQGHAEAKAWEKEERKRLKDKLDNAEVPTKELTVADWLNEYLDWVKEIQSKRTIQEKESNNKLFMEAIGKKTKVKDLSLPRIMRFLMKQFKTRSGYAANKSRKNLATAWEWGRRHIEGFPEGGNIFRLADTFPEKRSPRYVPPEQDFWKVCELTEGQDRVMLLFALHTAARRNEIYRAQVDDLDFERLTVRLSTNKREHGNTEFDFIPMTQTLKTVLLKWLEERPIKTKHLFVNLSEHNYANEFYGKPFVARQHFIGRLCEKAGVKAFTWHCIRHLTASILYHQGLPRSVIQQILRHKSPGTTDRYLKKIGLDESRVGLSSVLDGRGGTAASL